MLAQTERAPFSFSKFDDLAAGAFRICDRGCLMSVTDWNALRILYQSSLAAERTGIGLRLAIDFFSEHNALLLSRGLK